MERYSFTLRFDDQEHSLTQYNGLPIDQVGELLIALKKSLNINKKESIANQLVLSEVRGNCYALELTTQSPTLQGNLQVVHKKISENDFNGFTNEEHNYVSVLKKIIEDKYILKAYDKQNFQVELSNIKLPELPEYYYEVSSIIGTIVGIGGKTLDSKASVKVDKIKYAIFVSAEQESMLIQYYKKKNILLDIKKKLDYKTDSILSADLINFSELEQTTFKQLADELRNRYPEGISNNLY